MPLEHSPLEQLAPAVERAVGKAAPPPMKMMVARGMSPLPPADMATALYQLTTGEDAALREAAFATAAGLPDPLLQAALAAPLDKRVLDFYARRVTHRQKLLSILLLNKAVDDDTFRHLATVLGESDLEMIAKNEERLLRHPPIIAALYMNPKTRMSTAQRALELAVRNNVRVEGIPAFEEAAKAIADSATQPGDAAADAAADAAFKEAATIAVDATAALQIVALDPTEAEKQAAAELAAAEAEVKAALELTGDATPGQSGGDAEEKAKKLTELSPAAKIRVATLGNAFARSVLIREKNKQVAMACIRSPGVSDSEALRYAANRGLDEDIIRYISNHKQWTRLPGVRIALCNNPKTPMPNIMRMLPTLGVRDLKMLSKSKGIPSAVATQAKQLLQARGG